MAAYGPLGNSPRHPARSYAKAYSLLLLSPYAANPASTTGHPDIHVKLPFLKNKRIPRIAPPMEEKLVQGSSSDHLEDHCIGELFDAIESKDVKAFRGAIDALVMNCFEEDENE